MKTRYSIVMISSICFAIFTGCAFQDSIENHPECQADPYPPQCHIFYTTDRETCEKAYGDEAPKYCPEFFTEDKNECLTKIPEEMREKYCFKFLTETPEDCKKYFPDDYMKKCSKYFIESAEECKRLLPDSYLKDPHCASLVLTSKEACMNEFKDACKAIKESNLCFGYFIQNYDQCDKYIPKCFMYYDKLYCIRNFMKSKEDCIKAYGGEEMAKEFCPEYFVSSKEECIETFGDNASSRCPQFFTRTKEECVDTYKTDAKYQCPQFFARTKEECMQNYQPNEYNRYCPQFFQ